MFKTVIERPTMSYDRDASKRLFEECKTTSVLSTDHLRKLQLDGADINFRCNGSTPLCEASLRGNRIIVEYLLRSGAEVDTRNDHGATPLYLAVSNGLDICDFDPLMELFDPIPNRITINFDDVAKALVRKGAQVNLLYRGEPWISFLINSRNDMDFVNLVLDAGASPYYASCFIDGLGLKYMYQHCYSSWQRLFRKLLLLGFNVNFYPHVLKTLQSMIPSDESIDQVIDMAKFIDQTRKNAPSLEQLCRSHIRHQLVFTEARSHLRQIDDQLPIPEQLKKFLKLDER